MFRMAQTPPSTGVSVFPVLYTRWQTADKNPDGPFIDFCRGPHIPETSRIEAFSVMRNSATYFLGDAKNTSLQRINGISFQDKKQMAEHKKMLEEAAKRDHRKLGTQQELFCRSHDIYLS